MYHPAILLKPRAPLTRVSKISAEPQNLLGICALSELKTELRAFERTPPPYVSFVSCLRGCLWQKIIFSKSHVFQRQTYNTNKWYFYQTASELCLYLFFLLRCLCATLRLYVERVNCLRWLGLRRTTLA